MQGPDRPILAGLLFATVARVVRCGMGVAARRDDVTEHVGVSGSHCVQITSVEARARCRRSATRGERRIDVFPGDDVVVEMDPSFTGVVGESLRRVGAIDQNGAAEREGEEHDLQMLERARSGRENEFGRIDLLDLSTIGHHVESS